MEVTRHQIYVVLVAALLAFFNLNGADLFDEDEPKNAACAQEMFQRGDWIVPTFNHDLRADKPILLYWFMLAAYHLLGVSELSSRLTSATFAVGTALVVYHLGRRLYRPAAGLWAAVILSTSLMYGVVTRAATPDSTFIFFCTLALLCYVLSASAWRRTEPNNDWRAYLPASWKVALPMYAAMGMAVLAKGPAGIVLPGGSIGLFLLLSRTPLPAETGEISWQNKLKGLWTWAKAAFGLASLREVASAIYPFAGAALVAVIVLPWYIAVGIETHGAWLAGFIGKHNVGRFVTPLENHRGPIFYYAIAIGIGFLPWSLLAPASLNRWWTRLRQSPAAASDRFVACWAAFCIGLFSLAGTKLPSYVLPAYPALALITAAMLTDCLANPQLVTRRRFAGALRMLALIGMALVIGMPMASIILFPGEWKLGVVGLIPLTGAMVGLYFLRADRLKWAMRTLAMTAIAQSAMIFGVASVHISRYQTSRSIVQMAWQDSAGAADLAVYDYFEPSLVYYARQKVERFDEPEEVEEFFAEARHPYLITHEKFLEKITPLLPDDVGVIARKRRFLRRGDVVLLSRAPNLAQRLRATIR